MESRFLVNGRQLDRFVSLLSAIVLACDPSATEGL